MKVATNFDDIHEGTSLGSHGLLICLTLGMRSPPASHRSQMHRRGEGVVGGLGLIEIIVGMKGLGIILKIPPPST